MEVLLRDDDCNVISASTNQSYGMNLGQQMLHEIEREVEPFKQQALLDIEKTLLEHAQTEFTKEKKRHRWCVTVQDQ